MVEEEESSLLTSNELKEACFVSSIPHIVNKHEDWPSNLSEWTDPLLELNEASSTEQNNPLIDAIVSKYPYVLNTINRTFQRVQRVLATDTRFPELGPDTKTTIIGPFAAEILRGMVTDLEIHYEVAYAKGVCPCQQNAPGVPYFSCPGTATSIVCAPIFLDDSVLQSIQVPSVESSESSGSLSGSFAEGEEQDSSSTNHVDDGSSQDALMENSDSEDAATEDMSSSGSRPYNPAIYEAALRYLRGAKASSPSSSPPTSILENLHFFVNHSPDHTRVSFPLVCTAPHTEIIDVLTSALLHRRVFSVFDPVVGLTFDRKGCRVQVLYAWLESAPTSDCFDMHTAHAPLLNGMDSSCGLFDLSVYSSIVSLAAYLSRIIPSLSVSIDKAREDKSSFSEVSLVWRLDALPPQREEHEETRTEVWVTRIQNELSVQNNHRSAEMPSEPSKHRSRSKTGASPPSSDSNSPSTLSPANSPQHATPQTPVATGNKASTRSSITTSRKVNTPRSEGTRSKASEGSKTLPTIDEDLALALEKLEIGLKEKNYGTPEEITQAAKVRLHMRMKSRPASEMATNDDTEHLATAIFMDRFRYSVAWYPAWLHQRATNNFGKEIKIGSFEHWVFDNVRDGSQVVKSTISDAQNKRIVKLYSNLQTQFAVQEHFRMSSDPGSGTMTTLDDTEHRIFLKALPIVIYYSDQASNLARHYPNASEADCRFAWDGIVDVIMAITSENLVVRREMRVMLSRNANADMAHEKGFNESQSDVLRNELTSGLADLLYLLRTNPSVPKSETAVDQHPDINAIRSSGAEFLARHRTALYAYVGVRQRAISRKLEACGKDSLEYILSRAISIWYNYAICDACVSVRLATPKKLATALQALGGIFGDDAAKSSEVDTAPKASTADTSEPLISIPNLSQHEEIKRLAEDLENNSRGGPIENLAPGPSMPSVSGQKPSDPDSIPSRKSDNLADKFASILLPFLFMEYKKGLGDPAAGVIQAEFYLVSAIRFLATLGIFEMPAFAVATEGAVGRLICGWGRSIKQVDPISPFIGREKPLETENSHNVLIMMADTNCPEWNISDPTDALKFAIFLIRLRTEYRRQLVERFKEVFDQLLSDVKEATGGDKKAQQRFRWKSFDQLVEDPFWKLVKEFFPAQRGDRFTTRRAEYEKGRADGGGGNELKPKVNDKRKTGVTDLSSIDEELKEAKKLW
ncbi:hypothetical protein PM082_014499 [Marasmius tenuissimus]|nr:hypothetical protein PM082_014499 [Marasmius tenuissimus]